MKLSMVIGSFFVAVAMASPMPVRLLNLVTPQLANQLRIVIQ